MATFESENGDLTQSDIGMFESEAGDSRKLGDSAAARAGASLTLQRRIFVMLDEPDSGLAAQVISGVVMVMIFASSVSFVMESTQTVRSDPELKGNLHLLENSCIIAFTIEYVARMACCTHRLSADPSFFKYLVKPMNLVDLCAIAPFYIEMLLAGNLSLGVLRMLRMTRIFRVLKIGSFANDLQLFSDGMSRASEGLLLLFFMLILYFCVFATLLYMFEYQAQLDCRDCPTCGCPAWRGFTSIPTTMYFIMATMTTVGYGDMYPITIEGQLLCGLCMLWCARTHAPASPTYKLRALAYSYSSPRKLTYRRVHISSSVSLSSGCFVLGLPIVVIGVSFDAAFKEADKWKLEKALAKAEKRSAVFFLSAHRWALCGHTASASTTGRDGVFYSS